MPTPIGKTTHNAKIGDTDFISLFESVGPAALARRLGYKSVRPVFGRRERLEEKIGRKIVAPKDTKALLREVGIENPARLHLKITDGEVLIGSDAHYWPGEASTAHRAFVKFCRDRKQKLRAVVMNGDELDGASISRHAPIGWEKRPALIEELDCVKDRLGEVEKIIGGACPLYWPLGNHDARLSTRLATMVPEYARVHGTQLKDHFPLWRPCWSLFINDDVVIKHRIRGGIHATRNNALVSGRTVVTGHLHSLKVTPLTDYNGTRWGVDCGTLLEPGIGEPWGDQVLNYTEDGPLDHRAGFVLLTFKDGKLLWPEQIWVRKRGEVEFRGEVILV
jgi:hypothetical protein